jgi:hypothetical protein
MLLALALLFAAIRPDQPVAPVAYSVAPIFYLVPLAASNGDTTLAVWTTPQGLAATCLGPDGAVLNVPYFIVSPRTPHDYYSVAWVGGHYLVVWDDNPNGTFARRYAADATPIDAAPRRLTALHFYKLLTDGTNAALLLHESNPDALFQPVDADGTPIGTAVPASPDVSIGAANANGVVYLTPKGESVHVAWNGHADAPRQVGLYGAIVAGGSHFLVASAGQMRILDSYGAPASEIFQAGPSYFAAGAWNGSSWLAAWNADGGPLFRRIGVDGSLGPVQPTVKSGLTIGRLVWNGRKSIAFGYDRDYYPGMLFDLENAEGHDVLIARSAAEQQGGSIASTDTRSLVAWCERTGARTFAVRAAFIVDGKASAPFDIDPIVDFVPSDPFPVIPAPVVATDGRDFLVAWYEDGESYARTVTSEQILGTPNDVGQGPPVAAAWSGRGYVLLERGASTYALGLSPSGAWLGRPGASLANANGSATASIACDEVECAVGIRTTQPTAGPSLIPPPTGGLYVARLTPDGSQALMVKRLTNEYTGPPVVAMRVDGVSLAIFSDAKDPKTLRAMRLDAPDTSTPLVTRTDPVSAVDADRGGLYWSVDSATAGHELHWSRVGAARDPVLLRTTDLGWIPQPLAASSTGSFSFVTFTDGVDDPALFAPRTFIRTFAAIDPRLPEPPSPPRHRAAGH